MVDRVLQRYENAVPAHMRTNFGLWHCRRALWRRQLLSEGSAVIPIHQLFQDSTLAYGVEQFGPDFLAHVLSAHFSKCRLEKYPEIVKPANRKRCCDGWNFRWAGYEWEFTPLPQVLVETPPDTEGVHPHGITREYDRTDLFADPWTKEFMRALWVVITDYHSDEFHLPWQPSEQGGEIHFELFWIDVELGAPPSPIVSGYHSDGFEVLISVCFEVVGEGAVSYLRGMTKPEPIRGHRLQQGEALVAFDRTNLIAQNHTVEDLLPPANGGRGTRKMLIIGIR